MVSDDGVPRNKYNLYKVGMGSMEQSNNIFLNTVAKSS